MRTYSELIKINDYMERFNYLKLEAQVFEDTFGVDRWLNQIFYHSPEWKKIRDLVIVRDCGLDMGFQGCPISGRIVVHHMNPISLNDLQKREESILNPEYLISVSHDTHNAIHYGKMQMTEVFVERKPNDTCLWK